MPFKVGIRQQNNIAQSSLFFYSNTLVFFFLDKVPDDPKITYISKNMEVSVGQPARLFCEAFVGK